METSPPALKFRFRDHGYNHHMDNAESVVADTSTELSSFTSDEDSDIESDELASMTAKGINHLCLELIELKQASEVDFQDNLISNYSSFIRVFRETEGINNEVMQLKHHLMAQKQLVRNLTDNDCFKTVSDDQTDTVVDESTLDGYNPTTLFKTCANEVLETLDNLLFEHRLEDALTVFEIEDGDSPKVKFQEDISPDVWMCYKSDMAERRVILADKLTLMADNTRVSAAEMQKWLAGLCKIGFDRLATRLLFKYYHTRIASGVNNLQPSSRSLPGIYVHDLAKHVFSMMSQAAKSFVLLHGESSVYDSELKKWLGEETKAFADCFIKHVGSISKINGGLLTVVDSVHFAMSYCSLLESQKLELKPCLVEHIFPCMEGILKAHFDYFKKVISIFTSSDAWVMGRYLVSGLLTDGSSSLVSEQHPEYCLLTNSGRKFVSLLQAVIEDVSSLVSIFGSSVLEQLMDLFTEYCFNLEKAITYETNDVLEEGSSKIKYAESLSQKVSVVANLSTLEYFYSNVIRNLFKDINQLKAVIDGHMTSVSNICSRLRSQLCAQFIHSIMYNEASCIKDYADFDLLQDLMPSLPYQILFLEVRKVEELAEDNIVEFDWLASLLTELIETTFDWISKNGENWVTHKDDATDQLTDALTQFALDKQFLVEIARRGGYLTTNMINYLTDVVSRRESAIVSSEFDLNRYVVDYEKVANSATEAIKKLESLKEKARQFNEDFDEVDDEEYQPHSPINSIEDEDSSEVSFETTDLLIQDFEEDDNEDEVEDETETNVGENGSTGIKNKKLAENGDAEEESGIKDGETEEVSSATSDELSELRKIKRVSKVIRDQLL
ncbi:exocyst complex component EXO84B-like [Bidens hawaiensis]|uniref:exocyst complex component EXO84B-like n=1 Tax=Bidens hawaiensis TaxID=980011 RepID=UPI00404AD5AF